MCENCYIEAGSPNIVNEKTIKAAELIAELYQQEDCGAGEYAHIVVDDWNLGDSDIGFCLLDIEKDKDVIPKESREVQIECLTYLATLTIEERYSAMAINDGLITP